MSTKLNMVFHRHTHPRYIPIDTPLVSHHIQVHPDDIPITMKKNEPAITPLNSSPITRHRWCWGVPSSRARGLLARTAASFLPSLHGSPDRFFTGTWFLSKGRGLCSRGDSSVKKRYIHRISCINILICMYVHGTRYIHMVKHLSIYLSIYLAIYPYIHPSTCIHIHIQIDAFLRKIQWQLRWMLVHAVLFLTWYVNTWIIMDIWSKNLQKLGYEQRWL